MQDHEREFLVAEYEQAWAMILNIDERRFKFVEHYSTLFTAIVAVGAAVIARQGGVDATSATVLSLLALLGFAIGLTYRGMIRSERAANVRYRRKINLLRTVFLEETAEPAIQEYIHNHKDKGVKLISDPQPSGDGSTLTGVLRVLTLQTAAMFATIPAMWIWVAAT